MMNPSPSFPWQQIVKFAVVLASLSHALPAEANTSGSLASWQTLCEQYLPAYACEPASPVGNWLGSPQAPSSLADKLPTLPAGTRETGLSCFMRNGDGSLFDLTKLCNATSQHPHLAQISVTRKVAAPAESLLEKVAAPEESLLGDLQLGEFQLNDDSNLKTLQ